MIYLPDKFPPFLLALRLTYKVINKIKERTFLRDFYKEGLGAETLKTTSDEALYIFKRIEKKYLLDSYEAEILKSRIGFFLPRDKYSEKPMQISSVYFDNAEWKCYNEQMNRVNPRFKIRLREYSKNGLPAESGFAEIKKKSNGITVKERFKIFISQKELIKGINESSNCSFIDLFSYADRSNACYHKITGTIQNYAFEPVVRAAYLREAFENEEKTLRVTFDSQLTFKPVLNTHSLPAAVFYSVPENVCIMEIKYSGQMPGWLLQMLEGDKLKRQRFSKYCSSINAIYKLQNTGNEAVVLK